MRADAAVDRSPRHIGHAGLVCGRLAARAEILADRFWWQLRDSAEAEAAIGELASGDPPVVGVL
jgi:hypothetical protein